MELNDEQIKAINDEYNKWKSNEYAGNDKTLRKKMGQFYTHPEATIKLLSNFDKLDGKRILDPTAGAGHLLAAAIMAGADPNLVYANEPDSNIRNNVLIPRLIGLGVPLRNIGPYPSVVKKYGEFGVNGGRAGDATDANYSYGTLVDNDNDFLSDPDNKALYDKVYNSIKDGNSEEAIEAIVEEQPGAVQEAESALSGVIGPKKADEITDNIAKEAQQITNDSDTRNDEVNNANIEKALRKTIPGTEPDPLGINISNEERANWNGGEDRAVSDAKLSEMNNALASRTRSVKPGSEMLDRAQPKGLLGAGMLYSRDNNIPKPSEERPLDANNLEQITESNPEAVQEALPNTPIAEEARQITDDSDARNDEVNNEAAENTIKKGIIQDDYDPRIEENLNYEYPEGVGAPGVLTSKDEDFAGPDELPATIDQIKDEDFVGPDEQLSIINDGLPAEIKYDPVYDTSDYNFDWAYAVENVPELRELNDELDAEDKEEIAKLLGFKFGGKPGSLNNPPQDSQALNNVKLSKPSASLGSIGSGFLGKSFTGNISPSYVGSGSNFNTRMDSVKSIASKAPVPPEAASTSNSKAVSGSNNNIPHSNGTIGSGAGMMFQKRNSDLKVKGSNLPDLGGPHHQSEIEETNVDEIIDEMADKLVEGLENMLNEHPKAGEQLGFDHRYKHWAFNGISLDELPIDRIISLTNSLRKLV